MSVMEDLYHSEINASITWFWDGGFNVRLGDDLNGWCAESTQYDWDSVEAWLKDKAIINFPNSEFAKEYKEKKDEEN